jgi:hypothetical protein
MTTLTKTVTPARHFKVIGTVDTQSPMDMHLDLSGVDSSKFTDEEFDRLFDEANDQLNAYFDQALGMDTMGSEQPVDGMTVCVEADQVRVEYMGEGDGLLLSQSELADKVIGASVERISKR